MSKDPQATVGGQAVIEGVMMRAPTGWAVAVRTPSGRIETRSDPLPRLSTRSRAARIPFVRGVLVLGESLTLGIKALTWSTQVAGGEDEEEITTLNIVLSLVVAFLLVAVVFLVGPAFLADLAAPNGGLMFGFLEGVLRIGIFIGYIWLIGRMEDIKRVFQYHGAEHKTIHAYEAGNPLNLEQVQRYRPEHPRCGTSFLLIVAIGAVVLFSILGRGDSIWYVIGTRLALIPVLAGASYELLRFSGLRSDGVLGKVLAAPGLWLQRLTTSEPDTGQVEVAIASLLAAVDEQTAIEIHARGAVAPGALDSYVRGED